MKLLRAIRQRPRHRRRVVAVAVLGAAIGFVVLRAATAPDMGVCGCDHPPIWEMDDGAPTS